MRYILFIILSFSLHLFSQEDIKQLEKETKFVDFSSLKTVLEKDKLDKIVAEKQRKIVEAKQSELKKSVATHNYPDNDSFWPFISELWLVKNAKTLKWDFQRPEYGLEEFFATFLQDMGIYEKRFKILLLNTTDVTHFGLPNTSGEYLLLISLPFMRAMDLSKTEIALILLEDYIRLDYGYFLSQVKTKEVEKLLGTNFFPNRPEMKFIDAILNKYSDIVFKQGFDFQKQFEVTKKMDALIKNDKALSETYFNLIKKIDSLVKSNLMYSDYTKIYPSPELQLKWLRPDRTNK